MRTATTADGLSEEEPHAAKMNGVMYASRNSGTLTALAELGSTM